MALQASIDCPRRSLRILLATSKADSIKLAEIESAKQDEVPQPHPEQVQSLSSLSIVAGLPIEGLRSHMGDEPHCWFRECGPTWSTVLDLACAGNAPVGVLEIRNSMGVYFELDDEHCYLANIPTDSEHDKITLKLDDAGREAVKEKIGDQLDAEIASGLRNMITRTGKMLNKKWNDDFNRVRETLTICVDNPHAMKSSQQLLQEGIFEWAGGDWEAAHFGHQTPQIAKGMTVNTNFIGIVRHAGFVIKKPGLDDARVLWLSRILDYGSPECRKICAKRLSKNEEGWWKGILVTGDGNGRARGSWRSWLK